MFSKNIEDTFYIIQSLIERVQRNPSYFMPNHICETSETNCYFNKQSIKKTINNTETVNLNMFCQIPGVSMKTASGLIENFSTIYNMISTLKALDSQNEQLEMLQNIKINSKKLKIFLTGSFFFNDFSFCVVAFFACLSSSPL
jgi:ERCC4-type nuclease